MDDGSIYQLQVPMSASVLALGWEAFRAIEGEVADRFLCPESVTLEYRYHRDWYGGVITAFRVRAAER